MLKLKNITKSFSTFSLKDISLELRSGRYSVLLGPSGSGKTSLIKIITGIYTPDTGKIIKNGMDITMLPAEKRGIGYVPQNYLLYPHLSVSENIILGLRLQGASESFISERLSAMSKLFDIEHLLKRDIRGLSGGERQKISLARSIAVRPEILLLDEPFASIDQSFKKKMLFQLKEIIYGLGIPVLHITHDFNEAFAIGENLYVMQNGRIVQKGTKDSIFQHPSTKEIARFLGYQNIFSVKVLDIKNIFVKKEDKTKKVLNKILVGNEELKLTLRTDLKLKKGDYIDLCIREQDFKLIHPGPIRTELADNIFECRIDKSIHYSNFVTLYLNLNKTNIKFVMTFPDYIYKRYTLQTGMSVRIAPWQANIIIFS